MGFRKALKDLTPPMVWRGVRFLVGRAPAPPSYQGVSTLADLSALHEGRFSEVYDAAYRRDPDLRADGNLTRLRVYTTYLFAEIASRIPGDFVSVGISYGVAPKVLYELVVKGTARKYHLVDPLQDVEGQGYCSDPAFVVSQFEGDPMVHLHRAAAPDVFPLPLAEGLAFAELSTGNEPAELASMPYLINCLTPGGVMVIDDYGWGAGARRYDAAAGRHRASIFSLPTGQGVLIKKRT